jgi:serine protease Do
MKLLHRFILVWPLAAALAVMLPGASLADLSRQFVEASRKAKPSVVNIIIYQVSEKGGKATYIKAGFGSGTVITDSGYVITNNHVVKKGNYYQVLLHDGTECETERMSNGKFCLVDQKTDIAILKIAAREAGGFQPIALGDSDSLEEGEWVIAIGNPYGLRQSISCGIVSSKGRNDVGFADIEDFIQTDVPINPGNSGGPLVNLRGELVGINTAIRTISGGYQGISFAIPSNIVGQVSRELIRYGRVRRGWLGFLAREGKIYKKGEKIYVEVISVIKNSPAERAGIANGDIIKEIDGKRITTLGELIAAAGNKHVGSRLSITAARDGYLREFELVLDEKADDAQSPQEDRRLLAAYGLELNENSRTGEVVVSYLSPMGIGYQNGLKKGDIVRALNGEAVSSMSDFLRVLYRHRSKVVKLEIERGSRVYTIGFAPETD